MKEEMKHEPLMHACLTGDAATVEQIINLKNTKPNDFQWAVQTATTHGHVECVRLLRDWVDLKHNNCVLFRWAITKQQIECARLLIPNVHPQLPRSHIYINEIIGGPGNKHQKSELLQLCTSVFDLKSENSKSLRNVIVRKLDYAVDILLPVSDVSVALKFLRSTASGFEPFPKDFSEYLNALESRAQHKTLMQNITPTLTTSRTVRRKI